MTADAMPVIGGKADVAPTFRNNGWFIGGGTEFALNWLPSLYRKTEYRFAEYGARDAPIIITATGASVGLR
jgi:outer membrane immunogenic protein